jgi:hypothetical protein
LLLSLLTVKKQSVAIKSADTTNSTVLFVRKFNEDKGVEGVLQHVPRGSGRLNLIGGDGASAS